MAINHSERLFEFHSTVVDIQKPRAFGGFCFAAEFCHAFGGELVARAVESVSAHAYRVPALRNRIAFPGLVSPLVEGGFKQNDFSRRRKHFAECAYRRRIGRIVRGRDIAHVFKRFQNGVVRIAQSRQIFAENRLERHGVD